MILSKWILQHKEVGYTLYNQNIAHKSALSNSKGNITNSSPSIQNIPDQKLLIEKSKPRPKKIKTKKSK